MLIHVNHDTGFIPVRYKCSNANIIMNKNSKLAKALRLAKQTQLSYNALGSPSTQRVRNPFPLRELVQEALPALPSPATLVQGKAKYSFTVNGQRFVKKSNVQMPLVEVVGTDFFVQNSLSASALVAKLRKAGYIANPATVRLTINNNRLAGLVQRVLLPREKNQIGRTRVNYFRLASTS